MSLTISEQIARRGQGQAPSQLNAQRVPIYGDKATATSETKPLTWRLAHHDAVLDFVINLHACKNSVYSLNHFWTII